MARAGNYHDISGRASDPVVRDETPLAHWQWESEAIRALMGSARHSYLSLDALRRVFEDFGEALYDEGFHQRRTHAMIHLLIEKGVITQAELDEKVSEVVSRREREAAQHEP